MCLINREPTPAQSNASRQNSLKSTGPRTERGLAISSRNSRRRIFSDVIASSLRALGERAKDFERMHEALARGMAPGDRWEDAWVHDIAILRWRLEHLYRAEAAVAALRRRKSDRERRRAASIPGGSAGLELKNMIGLVGFTNIPDSAVKFEQVLEYLNQLHDLVRAGMFEQDAGPYFAILYGKALGPQGALLKARFETLAKKYQEGYSEALRQEQQLLLADLQKEIDNYRQLQAMYKAEHLEADQVQHDAELLLPVNELDRIIRYETHLEDQVERKLRQFYARRREQTAPLDPAPGVTRGVPASKLAVAQGSAQ